MVTPPNIAGALAEVTSEALVLAGINRRDAADLSGIPITTLQRRLTGRVPLNALELETLAAMAGVTVSSLVELAEKRVPARTTHVGTSDGTPNPQVKGNVGVSGEVESATA